MTNSPQFEQALRPKSLIIKIIWFGLTLSILIYVCLAFFNFANAENSDPVSVNETFKYLLYLAGIIIAISTLVGRRILFSEKRLMTQLEREITPSELATNTQTKEIDQKELIKINKLSAKELKLLGLTTWYFTPFIVFLALNEAITIFGLLLAFMSRQPLEILPFAIISIFLNLTMYNGLNRIIEEGKLILDNPSLYSHVN